MDRFWQIPQKLQLYIKRVEYLDVSLELERDRYKYYSEYTDALYTLQKLHADNRVYFDWKPIYHYFFTSNKINVFHQLSFQIIFKQDLLNIYYLNV